MPTSEDESYHGHSPGTSFGDSFSDTSVSASDTESTSKEDQGNSRSLQDKIASAMDKVIKEKGQPQTGDSNSSNGQAAASSHDSGDSTQTSEETDNPGSTISSNEGNDGQAAESSSPEDASDSTPEESLNPPDNWPQDRKAAYANLPKQARTLLMSFYKDMEQGMKKQFAKLDTVKKEVESNFGMDTDSLKDLAARAKQFQSDPTSVISQLAEEAGIDVFFSDPDKDEIPEFDSQADLVRYLQEQARNEARQAAANLSKEQQAEQQRAQVQQQVEQEFAQAYQAHPDLLDHKDAVMKYIGGFNIPVEMAYRLATWEGLAKLASSGNSQQKELEKTKAELENLQKLATMPPGRTDGFSGIKPNGTDPYEAAWARAEKKIHRSQP